MFGDLFNYRKKVPFSSFVNYALYSKNGYYQGESKISRNGDFLTSPSISKIYGYSIAEFFISKVFPNCKSSKISFLELGGNTGVLMSSVLEHIKETSPEIYAKLDIILIEQNSRLHKEIFKNLKSHSETLTVSSSIHLLKDINQDGFVFCNEFFDALIFDRCILREGILYQVNVEQKENTLIESLGVADEALIAKVAEYGLEMREDFYFELPVREYEKYFQLLTDKFSRFVFLINDYGDKSNWFHSSADPFGTSRCFFQHEVSRDFFNNICKQDITCDVNFTLLSLSAQRYGLREIGFFSQASFFLISEIGNLIIKLEKNHDSKFPDDIKKLISPNLLGEKFKFIIFEV